MKTEVPQTETEPIRRKLAEAYRLESKNTRWTKKERAAFGFMADSWGKTFTKDNPKRK